MVVDMVEVPLEVAAEEPDILGEVHLEFREIREQSEGSCDCVCIANETCCGCFLQ